jgi:hypothetical protein
VNLRDTAGNELTGLRQAAGRWYRQAQRLFHLLVGLAFLILAAGGATVSLTLWGDYRKSPGQGLWSFGTVTSLTVLLIIFSLYSFAKARSVR